MPCGNGCGCQPSVATFDCGCKDKKTCGCSEPSYKSNCCGSFDKCDRPKCGKLVIKCRCVKRCRKVRVAQYAKQCCPCGPDRWVRFESDIVQPYNQLECHAFPAKPDYGWDDYHSHKGGNSCGCH